MAPSKLVHISVWEASKFAGGLLASLDSLAPSSHQLYIFKTSKY